MHKYIVLHKPWEDEDARAFIVEIEDGTLLVGTEKFLNSNSIFIDNLNSLKL